MQERQGKGRRGAPKRPRDDSSSPEPVGAILERAGESRFARTRPPISPALWKDAVGARIAERAKPVAMYEGVLLLRVPTSVWAHELSLLGEDVCERLRERGVEVRELRFRVGALPPIDRPPERRIARAVPAARQLPVDVARALVAVDDGELRAAIERAAAANLAWQEFTRPVQGETVSEARRAARAPRSVEEGSAPPGRESSASRGASRRTPGGGRGRSR
jgi:hypothetical protein